MRKEVIYGCPEMSVENNRLYIDGCCTEQLAEKYGTPVVVYSKTAIHRKCNELKESFVNKYENTRIAYAAKAFLSMEMCRIIKEEGFCLDVVSSGELYMALKSGFPAERIEFNGNNKLVNELEYAIDNNIGRIIIDGLNEIDQIERLCKSKNKKVKVLFRITPGVNIDTHDFIKTGKRDSKFGIPIDEDVLFPYIKRAINSEFIEFLGFHFHIGSQLHDNRPYIIALNTILKIAETLLVKYDYAIKEINIGGGFGIRYNEDDSVKPYSYFFDPLMKIITEFASSNNIQIPAVIAEPGRSIVGEAGTTLYTVGSIKEIKGIKTYVSVDGGMSDNIRPALYDAKYSCMIADNAEGARECKYTICGKCCESGDILIKDIMLPEIKQGNLLAVFSTGAYCLSMSSNYNKLLMPAVVLTEDGSSRLIVRRQTYEDLIINDL